MAGLFKIKILTSISPAPMCMVSVVKRKHWLYSELFIGRFREPHPEPSGLSANHAQGARALRLNPVPA